MSWRDSLPFGTTPQPNLSYTLAAKMAPFNAPATTVGDKKNPWYNCWFKPRLAPTSFPSPGALKR